MEVSLAGHRNQSMLHIICLEQGLEDLACTQSIHIKGGEHQNVLRR